MLSSGDVSRVKTIGGWQPFAGVGEQLLLKVTSGPRKTSSGVTALAQYVARANEDGPDGRLNLFDEMGEEVLHKDIKSKLEEWDLIPDRDNLRPAARSLLEQGGDLRAIPGRERYWRNQAYHLVWSQTTDGTGLSEPELEARMREAVRQFVFDEFALNGHQVLWGVHRDHPGRPHIHMIVQARAKPRGQLRLDPKMLEDMRARLAQTGRSVELPVLSERREDRAPLLNQVLDGVVPLRANTKRVRYDKDTSLAEQVPFWFTEEGPAMLARKRVRKAQKLADQGSQDQTADKRPAEISIEPPRHLPDHIHPLFVAFSKIYKKPEKAMTSFFKMVCGSGSAPKHKSLSIWYLRHQPIAFGEVRDASQEALKQAAFEARQVKQLPHVDWKVPPQNLSELKEAFEALSRAGRYERDRQIIIRGLGALRRRMREENVTGPNLELVRKRMTYVRDFVADHSSENTIPQPTLHRVVKFFRPKRTPTR